MIPQAFFRGILVFALGVFALFSGNWKQFQQQRKAGTLFQDAP